MRIFPFALVVVILAVLPIAHASAAHHRSIGSLVLDPQTMAASGSIVSFAFFAFVLARYAMAKRSVNPAEPEIEHLGEVEVVQVLDLGWTFNERRAVSVELVVHTDRHRTYPVRRDELLTPALEALLVNGAVLPVRITEDDGEHVHFEWC